MVSEKPWRLEPTLQLALRLGMCFLAGSFLAVLAGKWATVAPGRKDFLNLVIATLSLQGGGLVLIAFYLREHQVNWAAAFGLRTDCRRALGLGLVVALVAMPGTWILQWVSVETLTWLHYPVQSQEAVRALRENRSLAQAACLGVTAILLAPVVEEMLFRGILYPLLKRHGGPQAALWGTAVLFALAHANVAIFVPLVFLAVMLTLLYEWTNNLLAPMLVHSLFNAANFAALYFGWGN